MSLDQDLIARVERTGCKCFHLAADLIEIAANETAGWTHRLDDAMRIPEMLGDSARALRARAKPASEPEKKGTADA